MTNQNTIKDVYDNAINRPDGFEWEYNGYTFRKAQSFGGNHSEIALYNSQGNKVESYTVGAFDSFKEFSETVLELVEYGPDNLQDWLDYRREQRNE